MKQSVGVAIEDGDAVDDYLDQQEREARVKMLVKQEIEEEDEEDMVSMGK